MITIQGLTVKNYKMFRSAEIGATSLSAPKSGEAVEHLRSITTLIGANGVGKSSLLDCFRYIQDVLKYGVETACRMDDRGGWDKIVPDPTNSKLSFTLYLRSSNQNFIYELVLFKGAAVRPFIWKEKLYSKPEKTYLERNGLHCLIREKLEKHPKDSPLASIGVSALAVFGNLKDYPECVLVRNFIKNWDFDGEEKNADASAYFFETPENGIYPHDILAWCRKLNDKSDKGQCFFTTYQPLILDYICARDVYLIEKRDDGFSTIRCVGDIRTVEYLEKEGIKLGELWVSGYFDEPNQE